MPLASQHFSSKKVRINFIEIMLLQEKYIDTILVGAGEMDTCSRLNFSEKANFKRFLGKIK